MTDLELMQEALYALTYVGDKEIYSDIIDALRARLAQPEPEPVAWISHNAGLYHGKPDESLNPLPLYTVPPQREWVGLTDDEIIRLRHLYDPTAHWSLDMFARVIEAKLKEKNT